MKFDTPYPTSSLALTIEAREEAEAEERAALAAMQPQVDERQADATLQALERLAAADLVMLLRHADTTRHGRDSIERARIAHAGRRLAAELLEGCKKFERFVPDADVPEYLRARAAL